MWSVQTEQLSDGHLIRVDMHNRAARFSEVLQAWRDDHAFRRFFNQLLADAPFSAFRWETPAVTKSREEQPFEFVLLNSPGLASQPDPNAFREHFSKTEADSDVVAFPNLGNDAVLVVPRPVGPVSAYGHLAAFVRSANAAQQHSLWRVVGETMTRRLGAAPIWLSTAGAGVSWLHVRLDQRPKYYGYAPYRDWSLGR
jgi:hypothetical protein